MDQQKAKILIIDDEPTSLETLCVILESGAELTVATTAEHAYEKINETSFDLILLDVELPDTSGFQVCRTLKERKETSHIPILFLTGFDGMVFESQAFDAGAVDYITKPASPYRVIMRVNAHLNANQRIKLSRPA
ncbi:MAG: putative two-component system response regulator [Zhongshania sp.]|jgi:putative two-component system response regulator